MLPSVCSRKPTEGTSAAADRFSSGRFLLQIMRWGLLADLSIAEMHLSVGKSCTVLLIMRFVPSQEGSVAVQITSST